MLDEIFLDIDVVEKGLDVFLRRVLLFGILRGKNQSIDTVVLALRRLRI